MGKTLYDTVYKTVSEIRLLVDIPVYDTVYGTVLPAYAYGADTPFKYAVIIGIQRRPYNI